MTIQLVERQKRYEMEVTPLSLCEALNLFDPFVFELPESEKYIPTVQSLPKEWDWGF
jgi:hypothetical protein